MVFIRPVVLRDANSSDRLTLDRYDIIRSQQVDQQPPPSVLLPLKDSPVLPPMRAPAEAPALPTTPKAP